MTRKFKIPTYTSIYGQCYVGIFVPFPNIALNSLSFSAKWHMSSFIVLHILFGSCHVYCSKLYLRKYVSFSLLNSLYFVVCFDF